MTFFYAIISGLLIVAGFSPYDVNWLTWVCLVPLLLAIRNRGLGGSFLLAHITGMIMIAGVFQWILEVGDYTLLHHALLIVYLGAYVGVFGLCFGYVNRKWGLQAAFFAAPFFWVCLEYLKSNMSFMALPWVLLSHTQHQNPPIIQIAAITGAYGVSFLIVAVNTAIAAGILWFFGSGRKSASRRSSRAGVIVNVAFAGVLLAVALLYGHITLSQPIKGNQIRVSVIQGDIPQKHKWDAKYAEFIMETFSELTRRAKADGPDLIVWPETATPGSLTRNLGLSAKLSKLTAEIEVPLLFGSSQQAKFQHTDSDKREYFNSAFLMQARPKRKLQRYDKIILLPFGEYLPYNDIIPWSAIGVPRISGYVPGKEYTVFTTPGFRFGATICWENIFPEVPRRLVKNGAQFLVNITNEAWFGKTGAPYQFLSMSVLRAVENQVFVIRCANTGVSCFIDPRGRVYERVQNETGDDIFVRGIKTASIVPLESGTFYTRHGEWIVWLSAAVSMLFLVTAIAKRRRAS